ncbi:putative mitochondrial protein AtMg00860 [Primulina tabacum]|uniref:putative mitochondrial protein AtMg00860 n=1 Tax=Primulina tabacum TaxID=48773 RepID=UPI003F5915E5
MDLKDFSGTTGPIVAEGWIKSIEVIFAFMELQDEDRIRCATFLLTGDARMWWESASVSINLKTLTWNGFKESHKLFAKFNKSEFWLEKVEFLGNIISSSGIDVDLSKVTAVKERIKPRNASQIRSFLSLAGYCRKFIQGFSLIAVPLTSLTKKNVKFIWSENCQKSFNTLKQTLISALGLTMPSGQGNFLLYTDASKLGLGVVLMQVKIIQQQIKTEFEIK